MKTEQQGAKKRIGIFLVVMIVVIALGAGTWWKVSQANAAAADQANPTYQTTTVRRGDLALSVSGSGKVITSQTIDLNFSVSGKLGELQVAEGDQVTKDQVLARLEGIDQFEQKVKNQELAVQTAQKALDDLQAAGAAKLSQALSDKISAQKAYEDAKANQVTKKSGRCDPSVTRQYYDEWLELENEIAPWEKALNDGNTGYGRNFLLNKLQPLWEKRDQAAANLNFCQSYTEEEIQKSAATVDLTKAKYEQAIRDYQQVQNNGGVDPLDLQIAQASLKNAQRQLVQAKKDLAGATLTAPMDGTVMTINGTVGKNVKVKQADETDNTDSLITIADLQNPQVQVNIDETDLQNFAVGCAAEVTFSSLAGQVFPGVVSQVYPTMVSVQSGGTEVLLGPPGMDIPVNGVTVVQGLIDLEKKKTTSGKVLPLGLEATVEVSCQKSTGALYVSNQAVYEPKDQTPYVYTLNDQGQPEKHEVELGLKTVASVEILSGLNEGDRVITSQIEGK